MDKKISSLKRCLIRSRSGSILLLVAASIALLAIGCRSPVKEQGTSLVVNAPANGIVRRVIVDANGTVDKDSPIVEIAVTHQQPGAVDPAVTNAAQTQAALARTDLASAQGEATRNAADVKRIEPLVKRGLASQAELDKARSQSIDAQERLKMALEKSKNADAIRNQPPPMAVTEEIVVVRAPAAGTVQAVDVEAGQVVVSGQALARVVSNT